MYTGYVDGEGRTYFRCTNCGDSDKHSNKAHAFIDRNGVTWCYRCEHRTQLSVRQFLALSMGWNNLEEVTDSEWVPYNRSLRQTTGNNVRPTLLTRYCGTADNDDAFGMYDKHGHLQGWHIRQPDSKHFFNEGNRGICWPGAGEGTALTSSRNSPRIVKEGPYDVTQTMDVAMFGKITSSSLKHLKGQHVVAFPDPDVIATKQQRKQFVEMLQYANDNYCWVQGLISANDDPDKATKQIYVPLQRAIEIVRAEHA